MMLVQAAAEGWGVPASECTAANSVITHKQSGRTTTYGKVAEAAAKLTPPGEITLKDWWPRCVRTRWRRRRRRCRTRSGAWWVRRASIRGG